MKLFTRVVLFCFVSLLFPLFPIEAAGTDEIACIYAVDQAQQIYHVVDTAQEQEILDALRLPKAQRQTDLHGTPIGGFCVLQKEGGKLLYTITDKQVFCGDTVLAAATEKRATLLELCRNHFSALGVPALLSYMSLDKITEIRMEGYGPAIGPGNYSGELITLAVRARDDWQAVEELVKLLKSLLVQSGGPATEPSILQGYPDSVDCSIEFSTGVRYDLRLGDYNNTLSIRSSDRQKEYRYWLPPPESRSMSALRETLWRISLRQPREITAAALIRDKVLEAGKLHESGSASGCLLHERSPEIPQLACLLDRFDAGAPVAAASLSDLDGTRPICVYIRRGGKPAVYTFYGPGAIGSGPEGRRILDAEDWTFLETLLAADSVPYGEAPHEHSARDLLFLLDSFDRFAFRPLTRYDAASKSWEETTEKAQYAALFSDEKRARDFFDGIAVYGRINDYSSKAPFRRTVILPADAEYGWVREALEQ